MAIRDRRGVVLIGIVVVMSRTLYIGINMLQ